MDNGHPDRTRWFPRIALRLPRAVPWVLFLGLTVTLLAPAQAKQQENRIDLNKATVEQLDKLPEVGPKLANAIIEFREKSGPFQRVEDLLAVPGISKRRLEKIRPHVYVEPPKRESASTPPAAG